jgi:hypothetical protein
MHEGLRGPLPDATYLAEALVRIAFHRPVIPHARVKAEDVDRRHPLVTGGYDSPAPPEDASAGVASSDPLKITRQPTVAKPEAEKPTDESKTKGKSAKKKKKGKAGKADKPYVPPSRPATAELGRLVPADRYVPPESTSNPQPIHPTPFTVHLSHPLTSD